MPIVPGYHGDGQDLATLPPRPTASVIRCWSRPRPAAVAAACASSRAPPTLPRRSRARSAKSLSAFGDDRVLIEKYVARPRHIEVQVFGDSHGNVVSLFERECTLQRRHQKVIEEAPAIGLTAERREAMSSAARAAAQAVGYVNAGTVEFIADDERLLLHRDEHPAAGRASGDRDDHRARSGRMAVAGRGRRASCRLPRSAIAAKGHAVEARIYAENPDQGVPARRPARSPGGARRTGEGIRVDTGFRAGRYGDAVLRRTAGQADRLGARSRDRRSTG